MGKSGSSKRDKTSRLTSLQIAFRTAWKEDAITAFERRIRRYRAELGLRTLAILNAKTDAQDQNIVEVLSINQSMRSAIQELQKTTARGHEEAMAAILTLGDGELKTITRRPTDEFESYMGSSARDTLRTAITFRPSASNQEGPVAGFGGFTRHDNDFSKLTERITNCLSFRTIGERLDSVDDPYPDTFQWIFRNPKTYRKPWSDYRHFLERSHGCYWISGKAGSGKSTLMKYIYEDDRTMNSLRRWAKGEKLLFISFFLWNAGTPLQKSQSGLLRSLLFQILEKREDLIPVAFPNLCRLYASRPRSLDEISFIELRKAFVILMRELPGEGKICIFIDGVDEYQGDHKDLSELFLSISRNEQVKVVISSRPIPACVRAFSDCPSLRLQDLTLEDIMRIVTESLSGDSLLQELERTPSGRGMTDELVKTITSKASGVILWVILVVKSVLVGLENYDNRRELLHAVDKLPADLEALYKHMLGSVSQEYQRQASLMLQLVMRSSEVQLDEPMTVLQLSYAEDESPNGAYTAPIKAICSVDETMRCKATEGRMRSRCCGLVESQESRRLDVVHVGFLHRTVSDFLKDPKIWADLTALTADSLPDLDHLLRSSCLMEMKSKPPAGRKAEDERAVVDLLHCLRYCEIMETHLKKPQSAFLNEAYTVLGVYSDPFTTLTPRLERETWLKISLRAHGQVPRSIEAKDTFLLLLILNCHLETIRTKLGRFSGNPQELSYWLVHVLLNITGFRRRHDPPPLLQFPRSISAVKSLLDLGADTNCAVVLSQGWQEITDLCAGQHHLVKQSVGPSLPISPWAYIIRYTAAITPEHLCSWSHDECVMFSLLLKALIVGGGDLDAKIAEPGRQYIASTVVQQWLRAVEATFPERTDICAGLRGVCDKRSQISALQDSGNGSGHTRAAMPQAEPEQKAPVGRGLARLFSKLKSWFR